MLDVLSLSTCMSANYATSSDLGQGAIFGAKDGCRDISDWPHGLMGVKEYGLPIATDCFLVLVVSMA